MSKPLRVNIKGMDSILFSESKKWHYIETIIQDVLSSYGYDKMVLPLVAPRSLFSLAIETSSIVNKEMFELVSKDDCTHLVLRPEGTIMCASILLDQGYFRHSQPIKAWYYGPMFRYEKPQKGRLRQFYQLGIESFNISQEIQEIEIICMIWNIFKKLKIEKYLQLEINNISNQCNRETFIHALKNFLTTIDLDLEQTHTAQTNPLRLLDSKDVILQEKMKHAPCISAYLTEQDRSDLAQLAALLCEAEIPYIINPRLVRGLDYYSGNVLEWRVRSKDVLGTQDTVCAGGRFDQLFPTLSHKAQYAQVHAFGCAIGLERIILIMDTLDVFPKLLLMKKIVYIFSMNMNLKEAMMLREYLISKSNSYTFYLSNYNHRSIKFHLEKASYMKAVLLIKMEHNQIFYNMCSRSDVFMLSSIDFISELLES